MCKQFTQLGKHGSICEMEKEAAAKESDQDAIPGEREYGGSRRTFMIILSSAREAHIDVLAFDGERRDDRRQHQQCNRVEDGTVSNEPAGAGNDGGGK